MSLIFGAIHYVNVYRYIHTRTYDGAIDNKHRHSSIDAYARTSLG